MKEKSSKAEFIQWMGGILLPLDLIEEREFGLKPIQTYEVDYEFFKQFDNC